MKRFALLLFALVLGVSTLFSQNVPIPDTAFLAALIEKGVDTNEDGLISYEEAEAVNILHVSEKDISDLTGIEAFISLQVITCSNNLLTSLDLSANTQIETIWCHGNELTNLDLSNNSMLKKLICGYRDGYWFKYTISNPISSLNISNCKQLKWLMCSGCKLINLDISNNTELEDLALDSISSLNEVRVWEDFIQDSVFIDTTQSPNVCFTYQFGSGDCINIDNETNINLDDRSSVISIFPNPTSSLLTIETNKPDHHAIEIISLSGQSIYRTEMSGTSKQIDLTPFSNGIYFITVRSEEFVRTEKVVKY